MSEPSKYLKGTDDRRENGRNVINNLVDSNGKIKKQNYINFGEEDEKEIIGYRVDKTKLWITWTFYIITLGILRLVYHWFPHWRLLSTHTECNLKDAEKVLIIDSYKEKYKTFFVKRVKFIHAEQNNRNDIHSSMTSIISINGQIYSQNDPYLKVHLNDGRTRTLQQLRIIRFKKLTYIWDEDKETFIKLAGLDNNITRNELHNCQGYSKEEQSNKRIAYGPNAIDVPVQSITTLILLEALTPFYMFQLFSMIVWLVDFYFYYVPAIAILSIIGISTTVIQTRRNQMNLKGTVHGKATVSVFRTDGTFEDVPSTDLVPGDIIEIPGRGCEMFCDAVLLNGSCIVNESVLTGESVPITKIALPDNDGLYDFKEDSTHTLYCGTTVIQSRTFNNNKVLAVVLRTGFLTAKGELVRSILYPPPADFKFDQDSYKFIWVLAAIAVAGLIYTIVLKAYKGIKAYDIVIKGLDLFTIAIPPTLPAAMTVGKLYAIQRLKNKNIFCINSKIMNVSGSITCFCFDKTGTLTEDGLHLKGIIPAEDGQIKPTLKSTTDISSRLALFRAMLTCHSLSKINDKICGHPLDVKMFESTGWILHSTKGKTSLDFGDLAPAFVMKNEEYSLNNNSAGLAILYQFPFLSHLQRMSVIVQDMSTSKLHVYCKGSPEMILSLSKSESIPEDILDLLDKYTSKGYRVLAVGAREMDTVGYNEIPKIKRDTLEKGLEFAGLIVFENKLKPQTTGVLEVLEKARIKTVMITGDNIQTAVSVAKECNMIKPESSIVEIVCSSLNKSKPPEMYYRIISSPKYTNNLIISENGAKKDVEKHSASDYSLVISGSSWANIVTYFPGSLPKIAAKGTVFARMSGLQKRDLIEELKHLGFYVGMCGDGSNDCSALKAANVGVSLSQAEASVASPFTSKESNISCVLEVIREGRAALMTSFGLFKFMLCASLTQFIAVIILYSISSNLTNFEFIFMDLGLVLPLSTCFGNSRASKIIHDKPPITSMLSLTPILSVVLFVLFTAVFQLFGFMYIQTYWWFEPFVLLENNEFMSYENYAIFCIAIFQFITMAIIFSKGEPYRRPIYTNKLLSGTLLITASFCVFITLWYSPMWLQNFLELKLAPYSDARLTLLGLALSNFCICYFAEDFLIDYVLTKKVIPKFQIDDRPYAKVVREIKISNWPMGIKCDKNSVIIGNINEIKRKDCHTGTINKSYESDEAQNQTTKL